MKFERILGLIGDIKIDISSNSITNATINNMNCIHEVACQKNNAWGETWNGKYSKGLDKDYSSITFRKIEKYYQESRDTFATMIDAGNMVERLKDFIDDTLKTDIINQNPINVQFSGNKNKNVNIAYSIDKKTEIEFNTQIASNNKGKPSFLLNFLVAYLSLREKSNSHTLGQYHLK